ncbi:MAG: tRNA dimethylallyltransferase [Pseudomonadota bacterium]|jgi:tRNA dimethylallyltransferase
MSWDAVLIAGPTASGKSAAALALAEQHNGAVVNADSMQVYDGLRVLTARPSAADEARAPHVLYGHVPVTARYSVGRYIDDAGAVLKGLRASGRLPIFTGGTGLYFHALTQGLSPIPPVPSEIRDAQQALLDAMGVAAFYAEFAERDPEAASSLNPGDSQRILRAASVLAATGRSLKAWQQTREPPLLGESLNVARFVIAPPRALLHDRIARRFNAMLSQGVLDEVRGLTGLDPTLPAARALGVPPLLAHLAGDISLDAAVEAAVTETRQYAKRQLTWFRKYMADWKWLEMDDLRNIITFMAEKTA